MTCITFILVLRLLCLAVEILVRRVKDAFVAAGVSSVIGVRLLALSGLVVADAGDQMFCESNGSLRQKKCSIAFSKPWKEINLTCQLPVQSVIMKSERRTAKSEKRWQELSHFERLGLPQIPVATQM